MDISAEVKKYDEARNKIFEKIHEKYPFYFREYSKEKLKEFDETQTGTISELTKKRKEYSKQLKEAYDKFLVERNQELNALDEEFKEKLYRDSHAKDLPNGKKVFDRIYDIAYEKGLSCGMSEVAIEFNDIDCNFAELLNVMNGVTD